MRRQCTKLSGMTAPVARLLIGISIASTPNRSDIVIVKVEISFLMPSLFLYFYQIPCMPQLLCDESHPCFYPLSDTILCDVQPLCSGGVQDPLFLTCPPQVNPLHPNISIHILHTVFHTFPNVLRRRICITIKSFFS